VTRYRIGPHVRDVLDRRGWTEERILETIISPALSVATRDRRHLPDASGVTKDEPAIAYIDTEGHYVVVNELSLEVIAISDRTDSEWKMPAW
jgi:hypothetical protein